LLVTDSNEHGVLQIDLSAGNVWKVPLSQQSNPIALAYDPLHSKIYWTDVQDKLIKRSNLDGTNEESVNSLHNSTYACVILVKTQHMQEHNCFANNASHDLASYQPDTI